VYIPFGGKSRVPLIYLFFPENDSAVQKSLTKNDVPPENQEGKDEYRKESPAEKC
jgi:hypothetical protein